MNSITQDILYKQSVAKYSFKHGVGLSNICHTFLYTVEQSFIDISFM